MGVVKPLARAMESFLILLAMFLVHRLLTYPLLFGSIDLGTIEGRQAFLVGALSDVWVAYLWSLAIGLTYGVVSFFDFPKVAQAIMLGVLTLVGLAAAAHVAYIEFFHFQIIPFHLRYLFDPEFVSSNGRSLFTWRSLAALAASLFIGFLFFRLALFSRVRRARLLLIFFGLTIAALFAHNRNLHFRVQWFVPDNLQVNGFERLYLHLKTSHLPKPLSLNELKQLATLVDDDPTTLKSVDSASLFQIVTKPVPNPTGYKGPAVALKSRFDHAVAAHEKPLVLVVLLESLRPSETGYFGRAEAPPNSDDLPSLTPNLDALADRGLAFMQAFSTGSVTRGAQEATLCGYRGARDTSVMRGLVIARISCLPEQLQAGSKAHDLKAATVWLHGGDGRFDGQLKFWQDHGIETTMTGKDFPAEAARSGWGVGDQTFLAAAAEKLISLNSQTTADFVLGLVLTVSNHIPWDLPADAAPELNARSFTHPSYKTTGYADQAVGTFVHKLKQAGLWQKTFLVLVSDHGNGLPPYQNLYGKDPRSNDLLASHVNLIVSGGLTEDALQGEAPPSHRVNDVVSQADVAPLLGYLTGLTGGRFFADGLLVKSRGLPVYSDLEQGVFMPEKPASEVLVPLYRRALFQYMSTWSN